MYADLEYVARSVGSWTDLGIKLPADLSKALAVFKAVKRVQVPDSPAFDLSAVTAANAESIIRQYADDLVPLAGRVRTNDYQSPLQIAKRKFTDAAARRVIQLAATEVDNAIEQLSPEFDRQAQVYAEAIEELPHPITSDTLVSAGGSALSAYATAVKAADYMASVRSWINSTNLFPGWNGQPEPVLRLLTPKSLWGLELMEEAHNRTGHWSDADTTLVRLDPAFYEAAKNYVGLFKINTATEAAEIRRTLEDKARAQALRQQQRAFSS